MDRLRAEVASMRTSADLEKVTPLLWRELTDLGVPFSRFGVDIVDEHAELVHIYLTNPQGASLATLDLPFSSHPHIQKYEVNITEEYEEGLPVVQGNFAQLGQVCMNLIKNAIEALKGQEGQIALKTYREGSQVVFECVDTGPGIPAEARQNIFKPFFTTKPVGEGTGLGLYICHQTVEKHKGKIEVESEVGKGTRFRVKLPMSST